MKTIVKHITLLIFFCMMTSVFGQTHPQGYRIEGDEVVFMFDKRDYKEATHGELQHRKLLTDKELDIETISVAGQFNDWAEDRWIMKQIDENRYELRKKIQDFTDEFSWEFKFVINEKYWAEPHPDTANIAKAKSKYGFDLHVFNLKMYTAYIAKDGNTSFFLEGHENAKKVILSGSFNRWNQHLFEMRKTDNGWTLNVQLKPGEHEYRFIVDGKWMSDKANPNKVRNEFNDFNSVVEVKSYYKFILDGHKDAKEVMLAGSFNDWSEDGFKMVKTATGWELSVLLAGGKHQYKFIVDNEWMLDPSNPLKEYDYKGNVNSVCMVR